MEQDDGGDCLTLYFVPIQLEDTRFFMFFDYLVGNYSKESCTADVSAKNIAKNTCEAFISSFNVCFYEIQHNISFRKYCCNGRPNIIIV